MIRCWQEDDHSYEEATMYHPNAMLKIAHDREAELVREAEICGMPKAEPGRPWLSGRMLAIALGCAAVAMVLRLLAV